MPKKGVSTSASLDPYETEGQDAVDNVKLQEWLTRVEAEFQSSRSPFLAAESILKQLDLVAGNFHQVDNLYLTTALTVLKRCAPFLNDGFRDIVTACLQEVMPVIFFNRNDLIDASKKGQILYSSAFLRVYRLYEVCNESLERYKGRSSTERRVMNRVLSQLDSLWLKSCFMKWRAHCRKIKEMKTRFSYLLERGVAASILPPFIHRWRQLAHQITMNAKVAHSNALAKQLEELKESEREVRNRYEEINEEVKEKMKLVEIATSKLEQAKTRLGVLESLSEETESSLREHWWAWRVCVGFIFGDAKALPNESNSSSFSKLYIQSITDNSAVYAKRAKQRTDRVGVRQLEHLVNFYNILAFSEGSSPILVTSSNPSEQVLQLMTIERRFYTLREVEDSSLQLCHPITAPFSIFDIITGHQTKLKLLINFLKYTRSGSHCSLFSPESTLYYRERYSNILTDPSFDWERDIPKDSGECMVEDVSKGLECLHGCTEYNDKYMMSVRSFMQSPAVDVVQDYIGVYTDRWRTLFPLRRDKVEKVTCDLVHPRDRNVVKALYPKNGIQNVSDVIEYTTKVSEFSGWPMLHVIGSLDYLYPVDAEENMTFIAHNPYSAAYIQDSVPTVEALYRHLCAEGASHCSYEKIKEFLSDSFDLDDQDCDDILTHCSTDGNKERLTRKDMDLFLSTLSEFLDPSPFIPSCEKIQDLLSLIGTLL